MQEWDDFQGSQSTNLSVNWSLLSLVLDSVSQMYHFDNVISPTV